MTLEKRFTQFDQEPEGVVSGYAVYWNKESPSPINGFLESFDPDSVEIGKDGCALYFQHDENKILADTRSGTLRLSPDNVGLKFTADLPKSAVDVREALKRKDVTGASLGFYCKQDEKTGNKRKIKKSYVDHIALTHRPAHKSFVSMRSKLKQKKKVKWGNLLLKV